MLTPANDALYRKWERETAEFTKRCLRKGEGGSWFRARPCERIDDLVAAARTPNAPPVLLMKTNHLDSSKLQDRGVKHHVMLAGLCRYWGNRFPRDNRGFLLKGAPAGWPSNEGALGHLFEEEKVLLRFDDDELSSVLRRIEHGGSDDDRALMALALEKATDLGTPYRRDRADDFGGFRKVLSRVYRRACIALLRQDFPLVVVDEAHTPPSGKSVRSHKHSPRRRYPARSCWRT